MCARGEAVHRTCLVEVNRWRTVGWKRVNTECVRLHMVYVREVRAVGVHANRVTVYSLILSFSVSELTPGCTTWR